MQHVNREVKAEEHMLDDLVRQTEEFKQFNSRDTEEKNVRLHQMQEDLYR